ncbi:ribonuclease H-like YkuK family protein [Hydrogenivirga sp.]
MPLFRDIEEVREFIRGSSPNSAIYVGCDSRQFRSRTVFVTVVVVHIDSNHGAKIFWQVDRVKRIRSIRQRLMEEVNRAVYTALMIADVVEERPFEVHLDINPNPDHRSSVIVKEAVGYVLAQGLKPVLKPDAIAASAVADFFTANF